MKNLANIDCWIFDLDNTLYPASTDLFAQVSEKMSGYIANFLDIDKAKADKMRYKYWQKYGTSLAGLMRNFKIDPDHFLEVVHDIDFSVLNKDSKLINTLNELPGRKIVYTNGTVPYARKVLKYRGLADAFDEIYGIENANYIPKPSPKAYEMIFAKSNIIYNRSAMFEDEIRNLKVPFDLGLKTILICDRPTSENHVDYSVESLPDFLRQIISTSLTEKH
ncbi:MAG: pyrimidine 5'-nucleotidase [Rhodobacteraceae bacterium TMED111]|nr:pyrimidine 5'-nucleotidase [Marinovum sp.]OUV43300.1 MAG: pyrimidine 5'-nucleotidase [Rhodobacteraceae bacterium TMED111]|tara:strand:- start:3247 stop:3909 length:663 start_codon:yes stop_codon:yes gene_type:complete